MAEWREATISDLSLGGEAGVAGGPFGSSLGRKHYTTRGVPVIRGAQLSGGGRFSLNDLVFVSPEKADRHSGNLAYPGDVIVTQRGTLGQVGLIPREQPFDRFLLSQSQMKITVDPTAADAEFVYFALRAPEANQRLIDHAMTSGVPHVNLDTLRKFRLSLPDVRTQRRIAALLSTFDSLIEINERRIELLENLARSLYREWFVHFRFPGHENVEFVDSELGSIPGEWGLRPLREMCALLRSGATPRRSDPSNWEEGSIPWFKTGELRDGPLFDSVEHVTVTSSARMFESPAILMAIYGSPTVGRLGWITRPSSCNQAALVLRAHNPAIEQDWLWYTLESLRGHFNSMAQGAAQQNISKQKVAETVVKVPATGLLKMFAERSHPVRDLWEKLASTNHQLIATRDLLLPRLVTGQLDISDIDLGVLTPAETG